MTDNKSNPIKKFNSNKEGIKIVKVAAFCFALISWVATAQGLHEYVFIDRYWQALLISFGIQAILFVFNIKLPYYFEKIGSKAKNRKKRKYLLGQKKGLEKDTYKWSFYQKLIAVFYSIMIIASSFFSFVYMTNLIYKDTQYIDANIALDRTYRTYLNEVDKYTNEMIKITQLTISDILSDLETKIPNDDETKKKSELETDFANAQADYNEKMANEQTAQEEFDAAKKIYFTPMSEYWRNSQKYAEEKATYDSTLKALNIAKNEKIKADTILKAAQRALDAYQPTLKLTVHDLLVESLKSEPDILVFNSLTTNLYDIIVQNNTDDLTSFTDIVSSTKELSISIDNYMTLQKIRNQTGDNNDIMDLKKMILDEEIVIPEPSSNNFLNEKENWKNIWKKRFVTLENLIKSLPYYTETSISKTGNFNQIVDINVLNGFDAQMASAKIDIILRNNLSNINALERAITKMFGDFPFLAWFSFGLAIFLDTASLLAGLFTYLTDSSYRKKDKEKEKASPST